MVQPRILVVVLTGGAGSRLELLTRTRAKSALPYGGHYRLVDVTLSNCLHSGFADVRVVEQNNPVSLADHLNSGRPWDLDRTRSGLLVLHPRLEAGSDKQGWHQGTADALWRHTVLIRELGPDALVVLSRLPLRRRRGRGRADHRLRLQAGRSRERPRDQRLRLHPRAGARPAGRTLS